jgi:hypothetical protein
VTFIRGGLGISDNISLTGLTGLENLAYIGDGLWITGNAVLTSLTGIDNINSDSIDLINIYNNPLLSQCEVESICKYFSVPNGTVDIFDNATGCNSPDEVQDSCEAHAGLIEKQLINLVCISSPNPFTTSTTISYILDSPENIRFTVYNLQSQIVFEIQEKQAKGEQKLRWNAEGLPAGMYYLRIRAGDKVGSRKMLKVE